MKLLEHEAKGLLKEYGVPTPSGLLASHEAAPILPAVLKSQVPVGGRGKAGGIRVVNTEAEWREAYDALMSLEIGGHLPSAIYAEEMLDIERELYLSLRINRDEACIELIAHPDGGIDIESSDDSQLYRQPITAKSIDTHSQSLADHLDIADYYLLIGDLLENLYKCFVKEDATLLEINPLVLTSDGRLVAADCKLELDPAAHYRHPDRQFSQPPSDSNYVVLDPEGQIATMANGAGLAMTTVDAVAAAGLRPANFLDIGGAATAESIARSFERICKFDNVDTIIINIFGGIVRCDIVAKAIIEARSSIPKGVKLAARLSGNRSQEAKEILEAANITYQESLEDILKELKP